MSKSIFEKDNEGYLEQYHYDLSKNESGEYRSDLTQTLYYGYRQAFNKITKLKAEAKELEEKLKEAVDALEFAQEQFEIHEDEIGRNFQVDIEHALAKIRGEQKDTDNE